MLAYGNAPVRIIATVDVLHTTRFAAKNSSKISRGNNRSEIVAKQTSMRIYRTSVSRLLDDNMSNSLLRFGPAAATDIDYCVGTLVWNPRSCWKRQRFSFKRAPRWLTFSPFLYFIATSLISMETHPKSISVEFTIYLDAAWNFLSLFTVPKCLNQKTHDSLQNL